MPYYVQRNPDGTIKTLYGQPQEPVDGIPVTEPEPLPDDHPEIAERLAKAKRLFSRTGASPGEEERRFRKMQDEHARLEREHAAIRQAVDRFQNSFAELAR